eukprot:scaffold6021_cov379-Prasinococcus_capsulatus_cf.AAC.8
MVEGARAGYHGVAKPIEFSARMLTKYFDTSSVPFSRRTEGVNERKTSDSCQLKEHVAFPLGQSVIGSLSPRTSPSPCVVPTLYS